MPVADRAVRTHANASSWELQPKKVVCSPQAITRAVGGLVEVKYTTSVQLNIVNESSGGWKWPNATNYGLDVQILYITGLRVTLHTGILYITAALSLFCTRGASIVAARRPRGHNHKPTHYRSLMIAHRVTSPQLTRIWAPRAGAREAGASPHGDGEVDVC